MKKILFLIICLVLNCDKDSKPHFYNGIDLGEYMTARSIEKQAGAASECNGIEAVPNIRIVRLYEDKYILDLYINSDTLKVVYYKHNIELNVFDKKEAVVTGKEVVTLEKIIKKYNVTSLSSVYLPYITSGENYYISIFYYSYNQFTVTDDFKIRNSNQSKFINLIKKKVLVLFENSSSRSVDH